MKKQYSFIILLLICHYCHAQIDLQCNGRDMHSIYLSTFAGNISRIDSVDTNPTNEIIVSTNPVGTGGISINANLDSVTGPETMYFCNFNYYFWNGISWTNTNHTAPSGAVNIGGNANYIFNLDGIGNKLYKYDGTSNGVLLLTNLGTNGASVYDIAIDNQGNFYIFYTIQQKIICYNPSGMAVDSFTTSGYTNASGAGFAILGNRMYTLFSSAFTSTTDLYEGIKSGNNINFTLIKSYPFAISDIAVCPEAGDPLFVLDKDSPYSLNIYPNPFTDELNIANTTNASLEIIIYDITSRKLVQKVFTGNTSLNTVQLIKGVYLYEVRNKGSIIKKGKVIKD